ncbi:MAG: histidine kinase [Shackletoniella antarctica]|uniref:histidine kinase n=1 Tax=Shackletoniella antarctica TaxID=268115 RepID=A0A2W4YHE3_9CYAN|nr:MAG: histidine kinase [Shackletoniella antarctica]
MNNQPRRTILIVEDSPEDREIYRRYLTRDRDYDYTIVEASLGEEGLNLWRQHQPDAVLLDYRLPDLDGLEFLAALQPQGSQTPLPIVMVTGVGNEAIAVQAIKAGAQDYLVKGQITPEGLKLALDATIKTVQLQTQLQQRIDRARVVAQIAQKVSRSLDLNEILHTTVTEVRQFLQTDRVVVFKVESGNNGRVVAESVGADWRSILAEQIYDPCFAESYVDLQRQGRVTVKADIYDGSIDPCHVQLLAGLQVRANLVVPILHDDQFWGVLIAHHCAAPRQWRSLEIGLLQQLSTQVSVAIRQAELYQQAQDELAERKRTEEVLRGSEERLRLGLQAARMGTWDWDITENRIIWSANMESLFGLAPGEFDGSYEQFVARLHPDDRGRVLEAIDAAMTPGANYDIEFRVLYPDGTIRWALSQGKVFYDAIGQPIRMLGVDLDITGRKLIDESLRQSEEFKKRVLESSSDCIKVLDLNAQLLYVNAGGGCLLEIDDLTPHLNSEWLCFWEGEHRQAAEAAFTAAKSGEIGKFQGFCATVNGKPKWWDVVVTPIRDGAGQVVQVLSTTRDVTERKRTEEELRQKNAILDMINESAPTPIFVKDRQGRIIYANPATLAALGKTAAEVIGFYDSDLSLSPEDAARLMENDQRIMASGQMEVVEESPDGIQTFLGTKAPYRNESGEVVGLIGILNNITDRVQLERDRERILQQKQAALAESERVNRIKDEFLAVLSHELRSPLNPILGWTKLLQTRKLDETKTVAALAIIERNAKAQCQLIDDLLDMARVLRGKLTLNVAPANLLRAIEAAIDTVQPAAIAKSIQINPVLLDIGQVSGDDVRLQQIVWNLLTNAVKFTPSGGRIDIRLEQIDNQAQITITDTGKGISPDFLPHIFESFRQEDASITRNHGGLGLGMAIVYQLIQAHGGTVTADSPGEGKGATFTIGLPLLNANSREDQFNPLKEQPLDLTGIRVLAVDDEPDSRELFSMMLAQAGAEVMSVASAAEFLTALESFQPDVVVSDIGMPEIDGYTLLRQMRSLSPEQGGQVPAIALTAYAGEIDRQQAIAAGFQRHIAKPIEPEQLVVAIVSLLSRQALS